MWRERTQLLISSEGLQKLNDASVAVIGLGGVGAYAAEMVARAGVGRMLILDSDVVNLSNKNRQLLALDSTIGKTKTSVMAERLRDINPLLQIKVMEDYLTAENIDAILGEHIDFLIDAIDTIAPKISLIKYCLEKNIPLVSSMGAGAKFDATKIRIADISKTFNCPMAALLRKKLRKEGILKGVKVVFSEEAPLKDAVIPTEGEVNKRSMVGTISYLPATFGCICAQVAIEHLININ